MQRNEYEVIGSPGEADAQLAFLQISGTCKYVISTSNDGDHMVFPGVDNIFFGIPVNTKACINGSIGSVVRARKKHRPAMLMGRLFQRQELFQVTQDIHLSP